MWKTKMRLLGKGFVAVDVGEDRPFAVDDGVEGEDPALQREGVLFGEGDAGDVAAGADQRRRRRLPSPGPS